MRLITLAVCITILSVTCAQAQLISSRKPDGLILSTGNLYFTTHDAAGATVWRTSQTSVPGQETVLYWEAGARFGDIVFAQVSGSFFGYFFAQNAGIITIKRVPLTGGNATTLVTITNVDIANSHRNLATDGVNLYWQDDRAVRKMPIGGGAVTVLDQATPNTPTAGIALQVDRVIYASVKEIRFVPKIGAITNPAVRVIAQASSTVTALHVVSNGVYWGERSGPVRVKVGSTIKTLPSTANLVPTSISSNGFTAGAMEVWTQCGSQSCLLHIETPVSSGGSIAIGADAIGATVLSSGKIFWGDAAGVHRR
ncbi:MAG TPA: hypothetical protein VJ875_18795 [Pyrinomonadaceae bacterium]|nr:hypothetical protein [Pyrinomonadaceae bacterium]